MRKHYEAENREFKQDHKIIIRFPLNQLVIYEIHSDKQYVTS